MSDRLAAAVVELVDALRSELRQEIAAERPDRLLSVEEAGRRLGVSRQTLYAQQLWSELHPVRVGRRLLIPESRVDQFVRGQSPPGAAE